MAVEQGLERSALFRALVDALDASDVVVYLITGPQRAGSAAHLAFVGAGGGRRYLRVSIDPRYLGCERIAMLGHELRHAVEIAWTRDVDTSSAVAALYRRIGHSSCGGASECFDTTAAVETGRRIQMELAGATTR